MSDIVIGIGTSHSPLLTMDVDNWVVRSQEDARAKRLNRSDGSFVSYDALLAEVGPAHAACATREAFTELHARSQAALDRLANEIADAELDVVVVVGDDQGELYDAAHMPSIAIYSGDEIVMHPWTDEEYAHFPWRRQVAPGYSMDQAHRHAGAPEVALGLIESLMAAGVDLAVSREVGNPEEAGFGHAYGFVAERLFGERRIPMVPVLLNTYYPPNVPTPARCYDVGVLLGRAIRDLPGDLRVGVLASGGLSHFVTDEALDRRVLEAMRSGDAESLRTVPRQALLSGSSEILNWIMAAGAMHGLVHAWTEYLPVYRTPAGTGVGLAFGAWKRS